MAGRKIKKDVEEGGEKTMGALLGRSILRGGRRNLKELR